MHHLWTFPCKKCKRQNLQKPGMTQSPHINWREQEVHSELVIFYFYTCIPNMWEDQKLEQHVSASAALFCLTLIRCQIRLHVTSAGILYELQRQALGCNCSSLPLMFLENFYKILCIEENLHRNWYMTSCDICWNFIWTT